MAEKNTLLRAFNTHLFELLDDIICIFPENKDIQAAKLSFQTIKRANPTAIIKVWYSYIYVPYHEEIEKENVQFFLEKDYSQDVSKLANSNDIVKIIDTLREPLMNMTDSEKQFTIKYLQNLNKVSMLYNSA
jgi:hypothetical protein